jgi:lipopolysaccharide transport system ATP-binding protein
MANSQADNDPIISLRNVGVCYRKRSGFLSRRNFAALKDVSFDLYHGETLGVIGRNGAGKTTLLRLLGGIISPDTGEMINRGYTTTLLSLQVGFDQNLTGKENAVLSGMLLGFTKAEVLKRFDDIVAFSELEDFIDDPIKTYSSGMKARLGFSVAFHLDPDVLLVDEVLGVGDAEFQKKSRNVMKEKIRSNKTIVLVSHSAATIRALCDRVVWIEHGVTNAEGGADEVIGLYEQHI